MDKWLASSFWEAQTRCSASTKSQELELHPPVQHPPPWKKTPQDLAFIVYCYLLNSTQGNAENENINIANKNREKQLGRYHMHNALLVFCSNKKIFLAAMNKNVFLGGTVSAPGTMLSVGIKPQPHSSEPSSLTVHHNLKELKKE